ncbi:hypothetical protein HYT17_00175 [Candidatus Microgenomates bacterium]|nr:hypothetical protein [Candidatus Microgenomates bacterium]
MKHNLPKEQILKNYEQKGYEIVRRMVEIVARAQRKVDNKAYNKALEKMER